MPAESLLCFPVLHSRVLHIAAHCCTRMCVLWCLTLHHSTISCTDSFRRHGLCRGPAQPAQPAAGCCMAQLAVRGIARQHCGVQLKTRMQHAGVCKHLRMLNTSIQSFFFVVAGEVTPRRQMLLAGLGDLHSSLKRHDLAYTTHSQAHEPVGHTLHHRSPFSKWCRMQCLAPHSHHAPG